LTYLVSANHAINDPDAFELAAFAEGYGVELAQLTPTSHCSAAST